MARLAPNDNWKNLRFGTDLRLVALERRLNEERLSRSWLEQKIGRGRTWLQKCFEQNRFPERDQQRIQEELRLPSTFFADIESGVCYEDALSGRQHQADTESEVLKNALFQLSAMMAHMSELTQEEKLALLGKHLSEQIQIFYGIADAKTRFPISEEKKERIMQAIEKIIEEFRARNTHEN